MGWKQFVTFQIISPSQSHFAQTSEIVSLREGHFEQASGAMMELVVQRQKCNFYLHQKWLWADKWITSQTRFFHGHRVWSFKVGNMSFLNVDKMKNIWFHPKIWKTHFKARAPLFLSPKLLKRETMSEAKIRCSKRNWLCRLVRLRNVALIEVRVWITQVRCHFLSETRKKWKFLSCLLEVPYIFYWNKNESFTPDIESFKTKIEQFTIHFESFKTKKWHPRLSKKSVRISRC